MSWFSRHKIQGEPLGPVGLVTGSHRSPALQVLTGELEKRRPESVLDLGASCPANLAFATRYSDNVSILDVAAGRREPAKKPFVVDVAGLSFGDPEARFDLVLLWDLLHYVAPRDRERFLARLARVSRAGTLVLLLASASAQVPPVPLRFRIQDREHLHYEIATDERLAAPGLTVRVVEGVMKGYRPLRSFQLRNGFQEFLFRYEGPSPG